MVNVCSPPERMALDHDPTGRRVERARPSEKEETKKA